jgi:hypothetical protein
MRVNVDLVGGCEAAFMYRVCALPALASKLTSFRSSVGNAGRIGSVVGASRSDEPATGDLGS